jgi:Terminase large subunit, T4likevirus-type, N-terminal
MIDQAAELLELLEYEASLKGPLAHLFDKQLAAAEHPSRRKVVRCSRRAGKTELAAVKLMQSALSGPNGICLYIALTRKSAKRLLWGRLKRLADEMGISYTPSETDLILTLANGSEVWLAGANQEDVAETLRGHSYRTVILDECASFRGHIDALIEEILEPATLDEDGDLWIIGTPSWDFSSYFYRANHNPEQWQSFHWTLFDNPHLKDARNWVADLKQRRGWSDDNPVLLREYYGQWAKSSDEMVYLFNPLRNIAKSVPTKFAQTVLGIDLGFEDKTALAIVAHEQDSPTAYVVHVEKHGKVLMSDIAKRAQELIKTHNVASVVIDEGGLGKAIAEEFRTRYQIPCEAAQKRDKRLFIELFNSELQAARVLVPEDSAVIEEWQSLTWADGKQVENPGQPNDCSDAVLYAWRKSYYYREQTPQAAPKRGTVEYYDEQERQILADKERVLKQRSGSKWR